MKKKKIIRISIIIAVSYFCLSLIYSFGGPFGPISDSGPGIAIEAFITFPALIVFIFGYGGGSFVAFLAAVVVLGLIWMVALALTIAIISGKESLYPDSDSDSDSER